MYKLFNHDWYPNVPALSSYKQSGKFTMNLHEKKHSVEHPGTTPKSNMHSEHCTLPYLLLEIPKYYQPKKNQDIEMTKLFAHSEKIYMTSHPICTYIYICICIYIYVYIYVYIYICRFIIWHMKWCTLILPFQVVSHHFHHLSSLPAEHLVCKAGYRWPLVASPNLAWDIPIFPFSSSHCVV